MVWHTSTLPLQQEAARRQILRAELSLVEGRPSCHLHPASRGIRFRRQVLEQFKELWRLADEKSHVRQELDHAFGDVFCLGGANDGAPWQVRADEGAWLWHDQVRLQVLARGVRSQIRETHGYAGDWIHGS
jgi:hypothetical protein